MPNTHDNESFDEATLFDDLEESEADQEFMTFKLKWVDLDLIDSAPVQPEGRVDNIDVLLKTMRRSGWISPPIIVPKGRNQNLQRYEALDGHRRIAGSRELGLTRLQCLVGEVKSPLDRARMFFEANIATRLLMYASGPAR